jgi:hypothetical protein
MCMLAGSWVVVVVEVLVVFHNRLIVMVGVVLVVGVWRRMFKGLENGRKLLARRDGQPLNCHVKGGQPAGRRRVGQYRP